MMTFNDNEKDFQEKLQKDVEIPVIVHERINQAYRLIENDTAVQKKAPKDPLHWMKVGGRVAGGLAAVLALGFVICVTDPVMAKNIPVVGGLFETLQDNVSFFGNFADHATTLENTEKSNEADTAAEGKNITEEKNTSDTASVGKTDTAYTKTENGLTITCSEVFANSQAIYLTMQFKSDEPFPDTLIKQDGDPAIEMQGKQTLDFLGEDQDDFLFSNPEGSFLDDHTYACILRINLAMQAKDYTEYNQKYDEMTQQVLDEMGVTEDQLNDETDEGYELLSQFVDEVSARGGALQSYIKDVDIPDTFNLHLDIEQLRGLRADYESLVNSNEESSEDAGYYVFNGNWSFDIPVTVDDSQTEVMEINETNDNGIGLKSVIRTPYELTVNDLYKDGSDADCFLVALDANGNKLPYNESNGNCDNFAIQDRDISTVDIYILDYIQYMDELKGEENYNNNENKPEGQKWSDLLDKNAKYHKTLHFNK